MAAPRSASALIGLLASLVLLLVVAALALRSGGSSDTSSARDLVRRACQVVPPLERPAITENVVDDSRNATIYAESLSRATDAAQRDGRWSGLRDAYEVVAGAWDYAAALPDATNGGRTNEQNSRRNRLMAAAFEAGAVVRRACGEAGCTLTSVTQQQDQVVRGAIARTDCPGDS